jgi:ethanolaminephosphotransferase
MMTAIIFAYNGFGNNGDLPAWALVMCGLLYLGYYIFDQLDGKHARNTGQSSPLGLLMDHGCDAITTFLITSGLGTAIRLRIFNLI